MNCGALWGPRPRSGGPGRPSMRTPARSWPSSSGTGPTSPLRASGSLFRTSTATGGDRADRADRLPRGVPGGGPEGPTRTGRQGGWSDQPHCAVLVYSPPTVWATRPQGVVVLQVRRSTTSARSGTSSACTIKADCRATTASTRVAGVMGSFSIPLYYTRQPYVSSILLP